MVCLTVALASKTLLSNVTFSSEDSLGCGVVGLASSGRSPLALGLLTKIKPRDGI
jgi:ABC-type cobalamin/Fe3+-siderophores transport system ATPase subunit